MSQVTNLELRVVDETKNVQEQVNEVVSNKVEEVSNKVEEVVNNKVEEVSTKLDEVKVQVEQVSNKIEELKEKASEKVAEVVDKVVKNELVQDPNVRKVVELLVNDPNFLKRVEETVKTILSDGKVDEKDVPEFVFLIMDSYNTLGKVSLTRDELPAFVKAVFDFVVIKFNLLKEEDRVKIENMVSSSVKLAMMVPAISNAVDSVAKKCWCW